MLLQRYHQINMKGETDMKIVYNNIIPFESFKSMACVWWIFARKGARMFPWDIRHEETHGVQQRELTVVGICIAVVLAVAGCGWWSLLAVPLFFWWYLLEWLIRWAYYRNRTTAYKNIAFEREAYDNEHDAVYLDNRKPFAFIKYLYCP